jgi:hypothetical protein
MQQQGRGSPSGDKRPRARLMGVATGLIVGLAVVLAVGALMPVGGRAPSVEVSQVGPASAASPATEGPSSLAVPRESSGSPGAANPAPKPPEPEWTAGDAGVVTAPGRDSHLAMAAVLKAHDPEHADQIAAGLGPALIGRHSLPCGMAEARRRRAAWMFNAVLAVDLAVSEGRATVVEAHFPGDSEATMGSPEFQRCFKAAVAGASVDCTSCKAGTLTVPFPVALMPYFPETGDTK